MEGDTVAVIRPMELLDAADGVLSGPLIHDGKKRKYRREYTYRETDDGVEISHRDDYDKSVVLPEEIPLTITDIGFIGMYSGDGAKGSESGGKSDIVNVSLEFSQKNPVLALFAARKVKKIFGDVPVRYDVAADSAFFLDKKDELEDFQEQLLDSGVSEDELEPDIDLSSFDSEMSDRDREYIENRGRGAAAIDTKEEAKETLRWWYEYKKTMNRWLVEDKRDQLETFGVTFGPDDVVKSSVRRPFVKGARRIGQDSRTDETKFPTLSRYFGELFLHIVEGIQDSVVENSSTVTEEGEVWIGWNYPPKESYGFEIDTEAFIEQSEYAGYVTGTGNDRRYRIIDRVDDSIVLKKYGVSDKYSFTVPTPLDITPEIAFGAGLYFAEGDSPKERIAGSRELEPYYDEPGSSGNLSLGFNSSTNPPMHIIFSVMEELFPNFESEVMSRWKIKIGSAYEPETVAVAEKLGMTFLRKGNLGQGTSRAFALGQALMPWALSVLPALEPYAEFFTHVEPTGAGIPRMDLSFANSPNVYVISIFYSLLLQTEDLETYLSSTASQTSVTEYGGKVDE